MTVQGRLELEPVELEDRECLDCLILDLFKTYAHAVNSRHVTNSKKILLF